jgi:hypothetical protein
VDNEQDAPAPKMVTPSPFINVLALEMVAELELELMFAVMPGMAGAVFVATARAPYRVMSTPEFGPLKWASLLMFCGAALSGPWEVAGADCAAAC